MRITQRNILMTHDRSMRTTLKNLTGSNNRMTSQRSISKAYEDPATAARAMRVRKQLRDDALYKSNIDEVHGRLNSADSHLQELLALTKTILDKTMQAANGTYNAGDREKIAVEVEALQKEVLAVSNSSYAQKYLFGSAGGEVQEPPFIKDSLRLPVFETMTVPARNATGQVVWDVPPTNETTVTLTAGERYEVEEDAATGDLTLKQVDDTNAYFDPSVTHFIPAAKAPTLTDESTNTAAGLPVFSVAINETIITKPATPGTPKMVTREVQLATIDLPAAGNYRIKGQNQYSGEIELQPVDTDGVDTADALVLMPGVALASLTQSTKIVGGTTVNVLTSNGTDPAFTEIGDFRITAQDTAAGTITLQKLDADGVDTTDTPVVVPDTTLASLTPSTKIVGGTPVSVFTSDGSSIKVPAYTADATPEFTAEITLAYHGMKVDDLNYDETTGLVNYYDIDRNGVIKTDPITGAFIRKPIPYDRTNYIDIGLGFEIKGADTDKFLDKETALPFTLSGAKIFGVGIDPDSGFSNNLYTFLGNIAESLRGNDPEALGKQMDHFYKVHDQLLNGATEIGARFNFADDMKTVLTNDEYIMSEKQQSLEGVDLQKEAIYNKSYDMAWMVTLQLGAKIIPTSLFDFMR